MRPTHQLLASMLIVATRIATASADPQADQASWLKHNAVTLRSFDFADDDFADLEPVRRAIGESRVVLLGEPSHDDGGCFAAKARMVRFLHEECGFDVLVWETGLYDGWKMNQMLVGGRAAEEVFAAGLLDLWSNSAELQPLFHYVHASRTAGVPLELAGFSIGYGKTQDSLFDEITGFFDSADATLLTAEHRTAMTALRDHCNDRIGKPPPKIASDPPQLTIVFRLQELLETHGQPEGILLKAHSPADTELMRRFVENLIVRVRMLNSPPLMGGATENPFSAQEGRNLVFLANQVYPNRKLIVWAHSGHLIRGCGEIEELGKKLKMNQSITAGDHIFKALGNAVYSIAFTVHSGQPSMWRTGRQPSPPANDSLEGRMHLNGAPIAFLDFRSVPAEHWIRQRLVAQPIAYQPMRNRWADSFDGVVFIDQTEPSKRVKE